MGIFIKVKHWFQKANETETETDGILDVSSEQVKLQNHRFNGICFKADQYFREAIELQVEGVVDAFYQNSAGS